MTAKEPLGRAEERSQNCITPRNGIYKGIRVNTMKLITKPAHLSRISVRSRYCLSISCSMHFLIIGILGAKCVFDSSMTSWTKWLCESSWRDFMTRTMAAWI